MATLELLPTFGMGVNVNELLRIIHFGPSRNIECYVQECGRATRDGEKCSCLLLHGLLGAYSSDDIKECDRTECRRSFIPQGKRLATNYQREELVEHYNSLIALHSVRHSWILDLCSGPGKNVFDIQLQSQFIFYLNCINTRNQPVVLLIFFDIDIPNWWS